MAVPLRTVRQLIQDVLIRVGVTQAQSSGLSTERILREMNYAWLEIQRKGSTDTLSGWPSLYATYSQSVAALSGTTPVTLTAPDLRQIIAIRSANTENTPTVLGTLSPRDAAVHFADWAADGSGSRVYFAWEGGYDPETGQWKVQLHPRPGEAFTLEILYEKYGQTLVDSGSNADNVGIPPEYHEALVLGTEYRLYGQADRDKRHEVQQQFNMVVQEMKEDVIRRQGYQRIGVASEDRLNRGGIDPRSNLSHYGITVSGL